MAEGALAARPPLPAPAARSGDDRVAGVTLAMRPDGRQAILLARKGQAKALAERCAGHGIAVPVTPSRIDSRGIAVVWTGPGQWLVGWEDREADRVQRLFAALAPLGAAVAADDARVRFVVRGARARETLAKMLTIDLHPRAFATGDAAVTVAGGMSVIVWRLDDAPAFELAVPRSVAGSFWDWLVESAVEYGIAIDA